MRTVAGAKEFGVQAGQPIVDFSVSQGRKQKVVDQLFKGLAGLMKGRGITTFDGTGELAPRPACPGRPASDQTRRAHGPPRRAGLGSVPRTIPGFDVDGRLVLTSDEVLALDTLPASVAVIGGGAIGCEFASMFADLGSQVTVLEALPSLLTGCDRTWSRRGPLLPQAGDRRPHRRHGHGPHAERDRDDGARSATGSR